MARRALLLPAAAHLSVCAASLAQATFHGIGHLPGYSESAAHGVSDTGVVVGQAGTPSGLHHAFRWTATSSLQPIGAHHGQARAITPDGETIVGDMSDGVEWSWRAFRWRESTGVQFLGGLSASWPGGQAAAVSHDGDTVAGTASVSNFHSRAFRWTADSGIQNLGTLPGLYDPGSGASAISADGDVVAGWSSLDIKVATRWDRDGMHNLGTIPGASSTWSFAIGISPDGAVIVGESSTSGNLQHAFRWTWASGMVGLGALPGMSFSTAFAVASDGSTIVGSSAPTRYSMADRVAFIWTRAGMRPLREELIARGATGLDGWVLREARAISPDGRWIAGTGLNPAGQVEAWIASFGAPLCYANCDGSTQAPILNVADFTCFLQTFAQGDPYANCDGSTQPPVLNVADFTCFLQKFAAGCP